MLPARYHDIALLKLDRPLELNADVRPACLENKLKPPGKSAVATGFGKTSWGKFPTKTEKSQIISVSLYWVGNEVISLLFAR